MMLKQITIDIGAYPNELHSFLSGAKLYDSSGGFSGAETIFIDKDDGYFLKSAQKGVLEQEAAMTKYIHGKGLAANVLAYISNECDWMLTERIHGDDLTTKKYLEQPERLCDVFGERLAMLHAEDFIGCPIPNHTERYLASAEHNKRADNFDKSHFPNSWGYKNAEEAWSVVETRGHLLKTDTLLHGDYCLPNVIFNDWQFSGLIDLDNGGVGDRHIDIFQALQTLIRNLKTDKYHERFINAYGRDKVDKDILRVVAALRVFD